MEKEMNDKRKKLEKDREEMERKERESMEKDMEEKRRRLEKEREEMEKKQRVKRENAEKARKLHIEEKENKERERKMQREQKRKGEDEKLKQREEESKGENKQEVRNNQSDDWPPLREAEQDDIAYDANLQRDEEQSESKSDPTSVKTFDPNSDVPAVRPTYKLDSRSVRSEDSAQRSVKKGKSKLKSGAIPLWLRGEEDEEVEYERGQEDLGSIWLAEMYMEGEAG